MEKYYNWSLITYAKPEEFVKVLDKAKHWAFIHHNKDISEPHYHILLTFKSQRSLRAIKSDINSEQNTMGQKLKDIEGAYEYLTHENEDDEKAKYDKKDIHCDSIDYWENLGRTNEKNNNALQMIEDIRSGLPIRELIIRYGRDYIRNRKVYEECARDIIKQEEDNVLLTYQERANRKEFEKQVHSKEQLKIEKSHILGDSKSNG